MESAGWDSDRKFAVGLAVVVAVLSLAGAPWWWGWIFDDDASGLVGGCGVFQVHAQNQFDPLGTKIWEEPYPDAESSGGFAPNQTFNVDGWVRTRPAYPTNSDPWNSDAWFHLANDAGWVSFAGVRADPTDPDDGNYGAGSSPVPLDSDCAGTFRR